MMDERFEDWLRDTVPSEATVQTKLSETRRLEKTYGGLDTLYDHDELEGLIAELTYSAVDKRNNEQTHRNSQSKATCTTICPLTGPQCENINVSGKIASHWRTRPI